MKKIVFISAIMFAVLSCESKKGSWTTEDKEKARTSIENAIRSDGSNPNEMQDVIDCCVRRLELYYVNFEEAEFDEQGAAKIVAECMWKDIKNKIQNENSSDETIPEEEPGC